MGLGGKSSISLQTHKNRNSVYYSVFFILTVINVLGTVNIGNKMMDILNTVSTVVGLASAMILVIISGEKIMRSGCGDAILPTILLLAGIAVKVNSGDSTLLYISLLVAANEGISVRGLARVTLFALLICLLFSVAMLAMGLIDDVVICDGRSLLGSRFSLGFTHPNRLGRVLLGIAVSLVLSRIDLSRITIAVIELLILIVAFAVADSRTTVMALIAVYLGERLVEKGGIKISKKGAMTVVCVLVAILMLGTLLISFLYVPENTFFSLLDKVLSHRLEFWSAFLSETGISLFGINVDEFQVVTASGVVAVLDGAYATALFRYGVIASVLFVILFTGAARKLVSGDGSTAGLVVLIVFIMISLTESYAFSPFSNFLLILAPHRLSDYRWQYQK